MSDRLKNYLSVVDKWTNRYQFVLAALILPLSVLPFTSVIDHRPHLDVHLYHAAATEIAAGKLPYRDFTFEYPPYAIPLFLLPTVFGHENYTIGFKLLALSADMIIKCLLLAIGLQEAKGIRSLLPLVCYCVAVPFIRDFYFQRYDVFPAVLSLIAVWLLCSRKYAFSGLVVAIGAGLKLYPVLFAPPLFVLAWRESKGRQFLTGLIVGGMPILVLGLLLPWWRFLAFHSERGLQAESSYASVLWLAHLMGLTEAEWEFAAGSRCYEVHGALADAVLPWSRAWLLLAVGMSTILACWAGARSTELTAPYLARVLLLPLLAFVTFGQVISPQFMIWLLPFAVIAGLSGNLWITAAIASATMLTPAFYLSPGYYGAGLQFFETVVLVARNLILIWVWVFLGRELLLMHGRLPNTNSFGSEKLHIP